jgi:hypothetical protein
MWKEAVVIYLKTVIPKLLGGQEYETGLKQ